MGKSGGDKVTQERVIPGLLQPFIARETALRTRALENLGGQLSNAGAQHLVEPFSAPQRQAIEQLTARAGGEGGFLPAAEQAFLGAARGDVSPATADAQQALRGFTGADPLQDPALREATTAAVRSLLPQISSTFARSGRSGSGLERAAIGQATADALVGQLGQERGRRLAAAGALADVGSQADARALAAAQALPGIATAGPGILLNIGQLLQQQGQRELEAPITAQERLLAAASGTPTQSLFGSSQSSPAASNPIAGALGGGAAGLKLGGALGTALGGTAGGSIGSFLGPIGGIAGALLGGILS